MSPATSTVTFFRGPPYVAAASLSRRVRQIVAANPWLTSMLERDPDSGLMEAYYHQPSPKPCFEVRADILLASGAAYDEMVRIVDPVVCKTSDASLGTGERLWRVCLIPDADEPDGRFALVVSANHSLLDGHGFYRLHTMLSAGAAVEALNPVRKQELPTRILQASGGEESAMAVCPPGFLARFLFGQLRGALFPSTVHLGFHVDEEWVAARKAEETRGDSFGTIADGVRLQEMRERRMRYARGGRTLSVAGDPLYSDSARRSCHHRFPLSAQMTCSSPPSSARSSVGAP